MGLSVLCQALVKCSVNLILELQSINRLTTVSLKFLKDSVHTSQCFSLFAFFVLRLDLDFFLDFFSTEVPNQMNQWMRKGQLHLDPLSSVQMFALQVGS